MNGLPDDDCPKPVPIPKMTTVPAAPPIFPASVYECLSADSAREMLDGRQSGYVYQRDGHPNAEMLGEKCRLLHDARWAEVTAAGMSGLAAALLVTLSHGDHVVVGNQLYGRTSQLFTTSASRLGITSTEVDTCDVEATEATIRTNTRLLVVETISNPLLRVAPLQTLAELAADKGVTLLVDNTFASPLICRPLQSGADLVVESLSKIINGHSDVMLGLICGRHDMSSQVRDTVSVWGMNSSPFDCWLASRGLSTLHLRLDRACQNASGLALRLADDARVTHLRYPGHPSHPDYALAQQQFGERSGWMLSFDLVGGEAAAHEFIARSQAIPFSPSLGEVHTTFSHPASTSHRRLTPDQLTALGMSAGTIRLSTGTESLESIWQKLDAYLDCQKGV